MQTQLCSLSLSGGLFAAKVAKEISGTTVPWEVLGYDEDFEIACIQGGFFDLSTFAVIAVEGPDAADYLQRMSTVNFKIFDDNKISYGAFLTGKGGVISLGLFQKTGEGSYHYLVSPTQKTAVLEHLEKFHFGEKLEIRDLSADYAIFALWKPTPDLLRDLVYPQDLEVMKVVWRRWSLSDVEFWKDSRRSQMVWLKTRRNQSPLLLKELKGLGVQLLGNKLYEYFRMSAGVPEVGRELHEKDIILEANIDEAVARNKGCYPGQEVVERIFTYGQVNRKLYRVSVKLQDDQIPEVPLEVHLGEKVVGQVVSVIECPQQKAEGVGLMYIKKDYWESSGPWVSSSGVQVQRV